MAKDAQPALPCPLPPDALGRFLLLPTVAMSLGWALRGTIGGGEIGALIPGAMVMLSLCWLLELERGVGTIVALGAIGISLGGQETYGQTIGFLHDPQTVAWGLVGLALKGGMWGLSGGALAGLAFMHARYRWAELICGLGLMVVLTLLGITYVDEPKLAYFSNRLDRPRAEVWVGLTLGALGLIGFLLLLQHEMITAKFAGAGWVAGAAGFGGGGLLIAAGAALPQPYFAWPWWKMMEFTFGALYGLGLGAITFRLRAELRSANATLSRDASRTVLGGPGLVMLSLLGLLVAVGPLWWDFTVPHRAAWSLLAPMLILIARVSNQLAWQLALSLTLSGFLRDALLQGVKTAQLPAGSSDWAVVVLVTLPVVIVVAWAELRSQLRAARALLGLAWLATLFGLIKIGLPFGPESEKLFVPAVFLLELLVTTGIVLTQGHKLRVYP